ncbi:MAG TPA: hypothetical protein VLW52_01915 [Opitutaceae bacterium]|nr:hypothetical protein [Opitutaceae bacterium]
MAPLVEHALVVEGAVVERILKQVADGGQAEGPAPLPADEARLRHGVEERGHRLAALGEPLQNSFELGEVVGMGLDGPQTRLIDVPDGGLAVEDAAPDPLADAALDVDRKVADILVRHPELDRDHEDVVGGQVGLFEGADLLNLPALEHAYHLPAVVEVPGDAVELPC